MYIGSYLIINILSVKDEYDYPAYFKGQIWAEKHFKDKWFFVHTLGYIWPLIKP